MVRLLELLLPDDDLVSAASSALLLSAFCKERAMEISRLGKQKSTRESMEHALGLGRARGSLHILTRTMISDNFIFAATPSFVNTLVIRCFNRRIDANWLPLEANH